METLGICPKPHKKPEVSGLLAFRFAACREAKWKVSGTQFLTGFGAEPHCFFRYELFSDLTKGRGVL